MNLFRLLIMISGFGASAILVALPAKDTASTNTTETRAWKAPPGQSYWKDDNKTGPYAPSWPTWAVVCKNAPNVPGAEKRAISADSTLFQMASPDLRKPNLIESIPHQARFATACRGDARGRWIRFAEPPAEPCFVLYETGGGNIGDTIRIFSHQISYESPFVGADAFQDHTFEQVFLRGGVLAPLVGDVDNDGFDEVLVKVVVSFGRSNAEHRWGYRIIEYKNGTFQVVGGIDDAKLKKLESF